MRQDEKILDITSEEEDLFLREDEVSEQEEELCELSPSPNICQKSDECFPEDTDFLGEKIKTGRFRKFFHNWGTTLVILVICIAILLFSYVFPLVRVSGSSMEPTYHSWNILITHKNDYSDTYDIDYDDVVICDLSARPDDIKDKEHNFIKRVVGRPFDTLKVVDGKLYRNNRLVEDSFGRINKAGLLEQEYTLAANEFFVMGDNRDASYDSRNFGAVYEGEITKIVDGKIM